jgi:hypothetical protein
MKRLMLGFATLGLLVSTAAAAPPIPPQNELPAPPQAGPQNPPPNQPQANQPDPRYMPGPASQRHLLQRRYRYSSYGTWVKTMGPGYPAYRYTYSGQKDNFPLPAIFQSGMEHNNWTYGVGFP